MSPSVLQQLPTCPTFSTFAVVASQCPYFDMEQVSICKEGFHLKAIYSFIHKIGCIFIKKAACHHRMILKRKNRTWIGQKHLSASLQSQQDGCVDEPGLFQRFRVVGQLLVREGCEEREVPSGHLRAGNPRWKANFCEKHTSVANVKPSVM